MNNFEFHFPNRVVFGTDSLDQLGFLARELGAKRALLVTDPGIIKAGYLDRALHSLKKVSLEILVFSDVDENPTTRHVQNGTNFARAHSPIDLIIALGGGSAMDCAKGINFLLTNGGKMEDYWGFNKATQPLLPSIGIPTTAGTGSEAQSYALISQENTHRKMACGDVKARFRIVILDPALTVTAPRSVTAVSGIDAITHAVETYVTTKRSPMSQIFSREAWRLLESNFVTVLEQPDNIEGRSGMLLGAHLAGIAIEQSMLGAAHACANPLTAHYGIAHGIAVGLMLPHVIRFNATLISKDYDELAPNLSEHIVRLKEAALLPQRLEECGVEQDKLRELAREAAEQWTGKFNPRPVTEVELLQLYQAAF